MLLIDDLLGRLQLHGGCKGEVMCDSSMNPGCNLRKSTTGYVCSYLIEIILPWGCNSAICGIVVTRKVAAARRLLEQSDWRKFDEQKLTEKTNCRLGKFLPPR